MKVIEILNFNRELLKKIQDAGIRLEDCRYIDLYADYMKLLGHGEKVSYIVAALSVRERYIVLSSVSKVTAKRLQCKQLHVSCWIDSRGVLLSRTQNY